jgi:RNA-binding protein Tab2/Atab2
MAPVRRISPSFASPPLTRQWIDTGRQRLCPVSAVSRRRGRCAQVIARSADVPETQELSIPLAPQIDTTWELDFYSRPVIGADGKKLWELIIVDSMGSFEHVEAIPNSMVNSGELRTRIAAVIENSPVKPMVVRFFRSQMLNMISIALSGLDVETRASRRTYALFKAIKDREKQVYPQMPGYRAELVNKTPTFQSLDLVVTERLPDALRCEKFAFGNFPLSFIVEFFAQANPSDFFGDACIIDEDVPSDALIPGIIIFSKRSKALAGWMSGIELAFVKAMMEKQLVVFECELNTVYRFADIDNLIKNDARQFQSAKDAVGGLHFLAIQQSEESDEVDGFWLLTESSS